jgi:hypothetical protein
LVEVGKNEPCADLDARLAPLLFSQLQNCIRLKPSAMKHNYILAITLVLLTFSKPYAALAQTDAALGKTIRRLDSLFWVSYNTCDTAGNKKFFTEDVEFYHDKGGLTLGAEALAASLKNNLCSNPAYRLRREAIAGSVNVFPLRRQDAVYGAIISGEHVFYVTEGGKAEYLDGQAFFTQLWLLKDGAWKMARILSYNHHPATYQNKRTEIKLSDAALAQFTGTYDGTKNGKITVQKKGGGLMLLVQGKTFALYPEAN